MRLHYQVLLYFSSVFFNLGHFILMHCLVGVVPTALLGTAKANLWPQMVQIQHLEPNFFFQFTPYTHCDPLFF